MVVQIDEPVDVLASFSSAGKLLPRKFRWRGRIYDITRIHQVHQARQGSATLCYFACSDGISPYRKLCFNNVTRVWTLEETEADG